MLSNRLSSFETTLIKISSAEPSLLDDVITIDFDKMNVKSAVELANLLRGD